MKKIVTHLNPDLDAVASVWLIKRFLPGWEEAEVDFAAPNKVRVVAKNPEVLHVDVGKGKLDHHQTGEYLSAAKLCWQWVQANRVGKKLSPLETKVLDRLTAIVTEIDNARDLVWPEIKKDRMEFYLHNLLGNLRGLRLDDQAVLAFGLQALDAVLLGLKKKITAQKELKEGMEFATGWGKAVALESANEKILWEGEVQGYCLVVRKDPESGAVRAYGRWDKPVDLEAACLELKKQDPDSDWFLHASHKLLLNQSLTNPGMRATKLDLKTIIKILEKTSQKKGGAQNGNRG